MAPDDIEPDMSLLLILSLTCVLAAFFAPVVFKTIKGAR